VWPQMRNRNQDEAGEVVLGIVRGARILNDSQGGPLHPPVSDERGSPGVRELTRAQPGAK